MVELLEGGGLAVPALIAIEPDHVCPSEALDGGLEAVSRSPSAVVARPVILRTGGVPGGEVVHIPLAPGLVVARVPVTPGLAIVRVLLAPRLTLGVAARPALRHAAVPGVGPPMVVLEGLGLAALRAALLVRHGVLSGNDCGPGPSASRRDAGAGARVVRGGQPKSDMRMLSAMSREKPAQPRPHPMAQHPPLAVS